MKNENNLACNCSDEKHHSEAQSAEESICYCEKTKDSPLLKKGEGSGLAAASRSHLRKADAGLVYRRQPSKDKGRGDSF